MPQMKPMNWFYLYLFFTLMIININIYNYFMFSPYNLTNMNNKTQIISKNWKW